MRSPAWRCSHVSPTKRHALFATIVFLHRRVWPFAHLIFRSVNGRFRPVPRGSLAVRRTTEIGATSPLAAVAVKDRNPPGEAIRGSLRLFDRPRPRTNVSSRPKAVIELECAARPTSSVRAVQTAMRRQVAPHRTEPASTSRCSANSALSQSITARTQAERRRSRWTMIQYSAAISGIGGVSRSSRGWPSPT
jgi:hypothetical protein